MPNVGDLTPIITAAITGGILGDIVRGWIQRQRIRSAKGTNDAHATKIIVDTATGLLIKASDRANQLEKEVHNLRVELAKTVEELQAARVELHAARIELSQMRGI